MNSTHNINQMRWLLYNLMIQNEQEDWVSKAHILTVCENSDIVAAELCQVGDSYCYYSILITFTFTFRSKHDVRIADIFTTCLQTTLLMSNVLFKRHFVALRLTNRRLTIFSAKFTLFASFRKSSLMRSTQKHKSIFLLHYTIKKLQLSVRSQ